MNTNNHHLQQYIQILKKQPNFFFEEAEKSLPYEKENNIRLWHELSKTENLQLIYYNTILEKGNFFSGDKIFHFSTCITDNYISFACIIQSKGWLKTDDAKIKISWEEIENASYSSFVNLEDESKKDNTFFIHNDPSANLKPTIDVLSLYSCSDHSCIIIPSLYIENPEVISKLLNTFISEKKNYTNFQDQKRSSIENEANILLNSESYLELLNFVEINKEYISFSKQNYLKTMSFIGLGELDKAVYTYQLLKNKIDTINENTDDLQELNTHYLMSKAEIKKAKGQSYESALNFELAKEIENAKKEKNYTLIKTLEKKSDDSYGNYIQNFLDINFNERKVITLASANKLYKGEVTSVLKINKLPAIQFPSAHPQTDETYVCHPFNKKLYIPISNYEKELLHDRINEYCYVLQCLGATSINIINTNSEVQNSTQNEITDKKIGFEISKEIFNFFPQTKIIAALADKNLGLDDTSGIGHKSASKEDLTKLSSLQKTQHFSPNKKPYLPENLTWFKQEPSWQRIAQQRLDGNLLSHNEYISSTQNQIINHTEFNKLKVDLNLLVLSSSINKIDLDILNTSLSTNEEWKIEVTFKPLDEFEQEEISLLNVTDYKPHTEIHSFTEDEQRYLEEIKFMFKDDFQIDEREEIILKRYKQRFGISDHRDIELRNLVIAKMSISLSDEEREYIDDLKNILGEQKYIDDKTRKILNKLSGILNLSQEKCLELETIYFESLKPLD